MPAVQASGSSNAPLGQGAGRTEPGFAPAFRHVSQWGAAFLLPLFVVVCVGVANYRAGPDARAVADVAGLGVIAILGFHQLLARGTTARQSGELRRLNQEIHALRVDNDALGRANRELERRTTAGGLAAPAAIGLGPAGCTAHDAPRDRHGAVPPAVATRLDRAIAGDELILHYQPQIDLRTSEVYGVEALVRWNHPVEGLIPPDRFISTAEQTGAIVPLTAWVLEKALSQSRAWREAGIDLIMSVNISRQNLRDPELCRTVSSALTRHEVPSDRLCLELTESIVMADVEEALRVLRSLSSLGVHLSIDDFGTGYSSLSYLSRLPVEELKIDRSFVQRMATDPNDATIVASTIGLGRSLGLRVVTEGVENADTLALLGTLDCDAAQGFHFARPLPPQDFDRWLLAPDAPAIGPGPRD